MSIDQDDLFSRKTNEIRVQIRKSKTNSTQQTQNDKLFKSIVTSFKVSDKCSLCSISLKPDQVKNCKFCGKTVCMNCSPKKRQNPQRLESFVRICDRCDMVYIKEMLFGEQKTELAKIAAAISGEEELLKNTRRKYLEKETSHQQLIRECTNEREETEEKIDDLQRKIDRNNEKINGHLSNLSATNETRKIQTEKIKELETKQTELLDSINVALFEKTELQRKEKLLDSKTEQLKDFLVYQNSTITHKNLDKNKMDSVLIRKACDSQFRESDYHVFQETPGTPIDMFNNLNITNRSNSSLSFESNTKGIHKFNNNNNK